MQTYTIWAGWGITLVTGTDPRPEDLVVEEAGDPCRLLEVFESATTDDALAFYQDFIEGWLDEQERIQDANVHDLGEPTGRADDDRGPGRA